MTTTAASTLHRIGACAPGSALVAGSSAESQRTTAGSVGRPRLTVGDMRRRDWRFLADSLPPMEECHGKTLNLKWLAWSEGSGELCRK